MAITWNAVLRLGFFAALLVVMQARAASIQIEIHTDTLGLNGQNWDLAFDLIDGNDMQPSSVTISGFAITGGSLTGAIPYPVLTGNVTGDLSIAPGIVTLSDLGFFFNEYLDNADIGATIAFRLDITGNQDSGLIPDAFSFFFVNPADNSTFPTPDPTGADALFVYNIGKDNQPTLFCPDPDPDDTDTDTDCVTATPIAAVPEPGALALALAGLLALGALRSSRKSPLRG